MRRLLIATSNAGKVREFREMLGDGSGLAAALSSATCRSTRRVPVEETGDTFRANACLKAAAYARQFDTWALADDSGLEVDALGGTPGVYSARWAEINSAGKGDADNNARCCGSSTTSRTNGAPARFVCVLALADPDGRIVLTARDTVEGRIFARPRGDNGFGYDPLFLIDALGQDDGGAAAGGKACHQPSRQGPAAAAGTDEAVGVDLTSRSRDMPALHRTRPLTRLKLDSS